jgi:cysteine desulfurase
MKRINLDHHAASPLLPEAWEAMMPFFIEKNGNPSSVHALGVIARDAIEKAREQVVRFMNAGEAAEIVFTSGGTESVNTIIRGMAALEGNARGHFVCTAIEHPSVINTLHGLVRSGFRVTEVPVDSQGFVDPDEFEDAVEEKTILACLHHANHDLGTIQKIEEITQRMNRINIPVFMDCTYSGGWLPLDIEKTPIDFAAFSPFRFHGPNGVGFLYRKKGKLLRGLMTGGGQENGFRPGTENVPAIVGAGVVAESAARNMKSRRQALFGLQNRLWAKLRDSIPSITLHGPSLGTGRISNNLNISFDHTEGEGVVLLSDMQGVACAAGSGCISQELKISRVLEAIGVAPGSAKGNIILSIGKDLTENDIDHSVDVIAQVVNKLRSMSPTWSESHQNQPNWKPKQSILKEFQTEK